MRRQRKLDVFTSGCLGSAVRHVVSRGKATPYAVALPRWPAWARCDLASLNRLLSCGLVEPIGIEPMT